MKQLDLYSVAEKCGIMSFKLHIVGITNINIWIDTRIPNLMV